MKKIRLALVSTAMIAGLMLSCNNDDDDPIAANLEGKWTPTKTITVANGGDQEVENYSENEAACDKDYREFVDGGAYRHVIWYLNASNNCTEDVLTSTWSKSGDQLIINANPDPAMSPPDPGIYEITKLTNSELRIRSTAVVAGVDFEVTKVFKRID